MLVIMLACVDIIAIPGTRNVLDIVGRLSTRRHRRPLPRRAGMLQLLAVPLLLLLAMSATVLAVGAADITELRSVEHFEQFVTHHKPHLNKALFFSKLGGSSLCDKLAEEFAGRLDFAVVSKKDASGLEQRFGVDEHPALRVVVAKSGAAELNVVAFEGSFKYGAFDDISAWLESQELAGSAPGVTQLLPGDELTEHCGETTPCIVLLTAGGDAKHDALVMEIAEAYAGDVVTPLQLDATAWPEAAEALKVPDKTPQSKLGQKSKKSKTRNAAGSAVFLGPMKNDRGDEVFLHRVLQKAKQFTADGVQRFVRSSMSLAAESVEAGEAAEGLTALRRLPRLNGGNSGDEEKDAFVDGENEESHDERLDAPSPQRDARTPNDATSHHAGAGATATHTAKHKKAAASVTPTSKGSGGGGVRRMKAKSVAKAAASTPLLLLLVSAKDHSAACTAAESLLLEAADVYESNSADQDSTTRVEFALVSLTAKKKGTAEADLDRLGLRVDQLPAYRW